MAGVMKTTLSTSGGAASVSTNAISGLLHSIYVSYGNGALVGTALAITCPILGDYPIFSLTGNTAGVYYPRFPTHTALGATDGGATSFYSANADFTIAVSAGGTVTDAVSVTMVFI